MTGCVTPDDEKWPPPGSSTVTGYHLLICLDPSDWRLPTIIELTSIVDLGHSSPSIDPASFPATPAAAFWSSSQAAGSTDFAWNLSFSSGGTRTSETTTAGNVRCVR